MLCHISAQPITVLVCLITNMNPDNSQGAVVLHKGMPGGLLRSAKPRQQLNSFQGSLHISLLDRLHGAIKREGSESIQHCLG